MREYAKWGTPKVLSKDSNMAAVKIYLVIYTLFLWHVNVRTSTVLVPLISSKNEVISNLAIYLWCTCEKKQCIIESSYQIISFLSVNKKLSMCVLNPRCDTVLWIYRNQYLNSWQKCKVLLMICLFQQTKTIDVPLIL